MVLVNTILEDMLDLRIYKVIHTEAPKERFSRMAIKPDILSFSIIVFSLYWTI